MEIKGTLLKICQVVDITLKDGGILQKGGFVIMREGDYPRPVHFEVLGADRIAMLNGVHEGAMLHVFFYPESRMANDGRYFSSLRCTNIVNLSQPQSTSPSMQELPPEPATQNKDDLSWLQSPDDQLPF